MRRRTMILATLALTLPTALLASRGALADPPGGVPPGHAKKGTVPPGLAKKGGMPPGLAKKYARPVTEPVYVAVDPRNDDRAWFLIEGRWELRRNFDASVRAEVRAVFSLPPVPPPVPLPAGHVDLRVVVFG